MMYGTHLHAPQLPQAAVGFAPYAPHHHQQQPPPGPGYVSYAAAPPAMGYPGPSVSVPLGAMATPPQLQLQQQPSIPPSPALHHYHHQPVAMLPGAAVAAHPAAVYPHHHHAVVPPTPQGLASYGAAPSMTPPLSSESALASLNSCTSFLTSPDFSRSAGGGAASMEMPPAAIPVTDPAPGPGPAAKAPIIAQRFKTKMCKNWETAGECPYEARCMFAHGDHELRTAEQNEADGLTTELAIQEFRRGQQRHQRAVERRREARRKQRQRRAVRRVPDGSAGTPPEEAALAASLLSVSAGIGGVNDEHGLCEFVFHSDVDDS